MATYAEFLKANGATDDEVKILDVASARKGFDALQAQATDAVTRATKAEADKAAYDKWYKEVAEPTAAKALAERDQAQLEAAGANAKIKKAQDLGLLKIMEQIEGGGGGDDKPPVTPTPTAPDLSKYVDRDTLLQVAAQEGDAIAVAQDIAFEHSRLFPDKPLNFRELRKQALANKQSVEQQWMTNYGVTAAREAKATADKTAYETKLREEGASSERAKMVTANPHLVSPTTSTSPFTGKPPSAHDAAQPWQKTESERESVRLQKGIAKLSVQ